MKKLEITVIILAITAMAFAIGFDFGKRHEAKKQLKISWPSYQQPGLTGTISDPDTVLMFKYPSEDSIHAVFYEAGRRLTDCSAGNYPF